MCVSFVPHDDLNSPMAFATSLYAPDNTAFKQRAPSGAEPTSLMIISLRVRTRVHAHIVELRRNFQSK